MATFLDLKQQIKSITYKKYLKQIGHLAIFNHKLLVCFAGTPCSGKSRLATDLSKDLSGALLQTDWVSNYIYRKYGNLEGTTVDLVEQLKSEIFDDALKAVAKKPNGLLILDKGIERSFEKTAEWGKENGFEIFVINVTAGKKAIEDCLAQKDPGTAKYFRSQMPRWEKEYAHFATDFKFDAEIGASADYETQKAAIIEKIKKRLKP